MDVNEDTLWKSEERETIDELETRLNRMVEFIKLRPETNIAIVGHGSFFGQFKDYHIRYMENGDEELKHCYPYIMELKFDKKSDIL